LTLDYRGQVYLQEIIKLNLQMNARYECYPSLEFIGNYLALQLERNGLTQHAKTFGNWSQSSGGLFAQAWVSAIAKKPT
jgi:hypothetical protein